MSWIHGFGVGLVVGACVVVLAAMRAMRAERAPRPAVLQFPERAR